MQKDESMYRQSTFKIDNEIRTKVEVGSHELEDEAKWIYQQVFLKPSLLMQHTAIQREKPCSVVVKIKNALHFLRNQQVDVPFILLYYNEFVKPELNMHDLWEVYYYDRKWSMLLARRSALLELYEKVANDRLEKNMEDLYRISTSQTQEELNDVSEKFALHYFRDESVPKALKHWISFGYDDVIYDFYRRSDIKDFSSRFGLTPTQFASNLESGDKLYKVQEESSELSELAVEYFKKSKFKTVDVVLSAAKFAVSREIAREPQLKKFVREIFYKTARISVTLTKKVLNENDKIHFTVKNKPVREITGEQFFRLVIAEQKKLLTIFISAEIEGNTCNSFVDEAKALYQSDESSENAKEWNKFRAECVNEALNEIVIPAMRKEMKYNLVNEAKEAVLRQCCQKLHNWISSAPYTVDFTEKYGYEWDSSKGVRAMGIAYVSDHTQAVFCAVTNGDLEFAKSLYVPSILTKKLIADKETGLLAMKIFIRANKPHVIVIGRESLEATRLQGDVQKICQKLFEEERFPSIQVLIIDNKLAKIYSQSKKGDRDCYFHPTLLRQAVSLARRIQDPFFEFCQLCADEEILRLNFHPLQSQLPRKELLDWLYRELINRASEMGNVKSVVDLMQFLDESTKSTSF